MVAMRKRQPSEPPRFHPGRMVYTPGALRLVRGDAAILYRYICRHVRGDWGDLDPEDKAVNERALKTGGRLLSAYTLPGNHRIWVITEASDRPLVRELTTVLLPDEY
jgi:hypothetical protein